VARAVGLAIGPEHTHQGVTRRLPLGGHEYEGRVPDLLRMQRRQLALTIEGSQAAEEMKVRQSGS
jgi:hypothetical protein